MIRKIKPSDYKACLDLYNYYILNTNITFEEKALSLDIFSKRIEEITKDYPWLVYEENGEILGYAYLDKYAIRSAYRYTCDLSIYIDKGKRNNGIGKKLFDEILKLAYTYDFKKMISIITETNTSSIRFHEALGFYKVGRLLDVGYKNNTWLNVVIYEYDIKE